MDFARALLNILDDSAFERVQLRDTESAVLNILEDSASERAHFQGMQRAVLNILEDSAEEKSRLEEMKSAVLNVLEDLGTQRDKLQDAQTELLRSENAIRLSLREKETLLKEVHHRVKNNLQVIASLLRLQARHLHDTETRAMFEESQNRVHSISLVHEMLYRTADLSRIDIAEYLRTLITHLTDDWKQGVGSIRVTVEAVGVQLAVDAAIPCGLIVNELVTNALKHAFPNARAGLIRVSVILEPAGWLTLTVQDDGVGMPEKLDLRRSGSLGLELVNALVRQLHATIDVRRNAGTSFEIRFQAPTD